MVYFKKSGVGVLTWDKIDFIVKIVQRDKECHHIMIKGSIHQEDIIIVDIYASSVGAPKYIKQT